MKSIGKVAQVDLENESERKFSELTVLQKPFEFWHFLSETIEAVLGPKSLKWLIRHRCSLLSFWLICQIKMGDPVDRQVCLKHA